MKIFKLNSTYSVVCESIGNRSGFKHEATLIRNGVQIDSTKVQYYNRTWERYEFESILQKMFEVTTMLTDKEKRRFRNKV